MNVYSVHCQRLTTSCGLSYDDMMFMRWCVRKYVKQFLCYHFFLLTIILLHFIPFFLNSEFRVTWNSESFWSFSSWIFWDTKCMQSIWSGSHQWRRLRSNGRDLDILVFALLLFISKMFTDWLNYLSERVVSFLHCFYYCPSLHSF